MSSVDLADLEAAPPPRVLSCMKCKGSKIRCIEVPGSNRCVNCTKRGIECVRPESKRVRHSRKPRPSTSTSDQEAASQSPSALPDRNLQPHASFSSPAASSSSNRLTPSVDHQASTFNNTQIDKPSLNHHSSYQSQRYTFSSTTPISSERENPQSQPPQEPQPHASTSAAGAQEFVDQTEKATDPGLPALYNPLKLLGLYMSSGAYVPRTDDYPKLNPLQCGLISSARASQFVTFFMNELNASLCLVDPKMYSYEIISKHPSLLTVICLIVSRMEDDEEAAQICERLQFHFENTVYPAVVLEGYRTTEIAIAFLFYAAYHPGTTSLREDRTWTYAGHSLRMAIELDLNSRIHSGGLNKNDEKMQRLFRNRERTWINIWLFDQSMSSQAGVRPSLGEQGIIATCSTWHLSEFRVPGDGALVAQVQLRRLFTHHKELFERLGLLWHRNDSLPFDSTKLLNIEFYLKSLEDSFTSWNTQWLDVEPGTKRGARLKVYSLYAKVFLLSMPLQSFYKNTSAALPIFMSMYECVVAYLEEFIGGKAVPAFNSTQNSTFVHGAYVSIMALKLTTLSTKYSFIDVDHILHWVSQVVEAFHVAANSTKHRRSPAATYAGSLQKLLNDCISRKNSSGNQNGRDHSNQYGQEHSNSILRQGQPSATSTAMSLSSPGNLLSAPLGYNVGPSHSGSPYAPAIDPQENFQNGFPAFEGEGFFDAFSDRAALSDAEFLALLNQPYDQ